MGKGKTRATELRALRGWPFGSPESTMKVLRRRAGGASRLVVTDFNFHRLFQPEGKPVPPTRRNGPTFLVGDFWICECAPNSFGSVYQGRTWSTEQTEKPARCWPGFGESQ